MDFNDVCTLRRSVRVYKDSGMDSAEISSKIKTALDFIRVNAPSWKNSQTHRYYAAVSVEKISKVTDSLVERNRPKCQNAVALIVTAFEKNVSGFTNGTPDNEMGNLWGAYDLGLSDSMLILKLREEGLDTLIMGLRESEELRKIFNIPESQQIASVISVGIRADEVNPPNHKELTEICVIE